MSHLNESIIYSCGADGRWQLNNITVEKLEDTDTSTILAIIEQIQDPLVLVLAALGVPGHMLLVSTLSRKPLYSAINVIMIRLSIAQIILLTAYAVITMFKWLADDMCMRILWGKYWTWLLLVCVNASLVFHTAAVFHVVTLSFIRYITTAYFINRSDGQNFFSIRTAKVTSVGVYLVVIAICGPFYLNSEVGKTVHPVCCKPFGEPEEIVYQLQFSDIAKDTGLLTFNFWFFGAIGKLLPCAVLMVTSTLLVFRLRHLHEEQKRKMTSSSATMVQQHAAFQRTTKMIIVVAFIFLSVEFPQGLLNLWVAIDHSVATRPFYLPLSDMFELLTVTYSSINCVIFCCMNSQFRRVMATRLRQFCLRAYPCNDCTPYVRNSDTRSGRARNRFLKFTARHERKLQAAANRNDGTAAPTTTTNNKALGNAAKGECRPHETGHGSESGRQDQPSPRDRQPKQSLCARKLGQSLQSLDTALEMRARQQRDQNPRTPGERDRLLHFGHRDLISALTAPLPRHKTRLVSNGVSYIDGSLSQPELNEQNFSLVEHYSDIEMIDRTESGEVSLSKDGCDALL